MTEKFGEKLKKIRTSQKLTQGQVAKGAGISLTAYGNIERGNSFPKPETIQLIADTLGVTSDDLWKRRDSLEDVRFRANHKLLARDRVLLDTEEWLSKRNLLADKLGLSELSFENPLNDFILSVKDSISREETSIPGLADDLRSYWELGDKPIRNLMLLLESRGVKVFPYKIHSPYFCGLSVGADGGGPAIVVNTVESLSVERWIFSAAHELGHLILHCSSFGVGKNYNPADEDKEEKEADLFASHFLMPNKRFIYEWNKLKGAGFAERILAVKKIFKVSWATVVYRLNKLVSGEKNIWLKANAALKRIGKSTKGHREPDPLVAMDFFGSNYSDIMLKKLVYRAFFEDKISEDEVGEILGLNSEQVGELLVDWILGKDLEDLDSDFNAE